MSPPVWKAIKVIFAVIILGMMAGVKIIKSAPERCAIERLVREAPHLHLRTALLDRLKLRSRNLSDFSSWTGLKAQKLGEE